MNNYMFYTEIDGETRVETGLTKIQARRKYNSFSRNTPEGATRWGWEEDQNSLHSQIIRARADKVNS